jgi:hypothetical protein
MEKNTAEVIGMCCTICVLNRESTLNVELQFELDDFCTEGFVFYQQITILNMLFGRSFDERTITKLDAAYGLKLGLPV